MGDPRNACPKLISKQVKLQADRKGVLSAIGNLAELQVLEELGIVNNNTRQGLAAIATASNFIRTGNPTSNGIVKSLLNTSLESLEDGADIVLTATGIGRVGLDAVNAIDANVANRALGAAKQVFSKAKQGEFTLTDLPSALADIQNLESLIRGIFKPGIKDVSPLSRFKCQPSPYALDLVHRAPKMKFLYIVEIKFTEPYNQLDRVAATMAFVTKTASRPQVDFEYEEVNMYNYRTQVLKRTQLQPMQLRFIDDVQGNTIRFYEMYLKAMSPIANLDPGKTGGQVGTFEENSMDFTSRQPVSFSERFPDQQEVTTEPTSRSVAESFSNAKTSLEAKFNGISNTVGSVFSNDGASGINNANYYANGNGTRQTIRLPNYSASAGALQPGTNGEYHKQLLESITIHHIGDYGDTITSYQMFNPRITSFQLDELTMAESGEGSDMMFEFNYDSLLISPNVLMSSFGPNKLEDITGGTVGATYPIKQTGISEGVKSEGGGMNPNSGSLATSTSNNTSGVGYGAISADVTGTATQAVTDGVTVAAVPTATAFDVIRTG